MFSKNVCLKSKTSYTRKTKKEDTFTMTIQINSNQIMDKDVLERLEKEINNISVYDYSLVKKNQ